MQYNPQNPIIVQGDKSVLLEVNNPLYQEARDILSRFAELEKSPEYIHTYRISPLSLWNAASAGLAAEAIVAGLAKYSKYPLPGNVEVDIREYIGRYGRVRLTRRDNDLLLTSDDKPLILELLRRKELKGYILNQEDDVTLRVDPAKRGHIKQALVNIGYPAEDLAGYVSGDSVAFNLRLMTNSGKPFALRHYQQEAGEVFYADGAAHGGSGVIVLPCGAGKTIVGMSVMNEMQCSTLILTPNTVSVRQWIDELLDKTTLTEEQVGEYSGQRKEIRPITISTPPAHIVAYNAWKLEVTQAILANELGHIRSFEAGDYTGGPAAEAAADEFAGRVFARLAARTTAAERLFHLIGCRTLVCSHPRPHERRDAFRRGQHAETVMMVYEGFAVGY